MVKILTAVLTDGLPAVEAACAEALDAGIVSADVILNALARRTQPEKAATIKPPERLALTQPPRADCGRYDALRTMLAMEAGCHAGLGEAKLRLDGVPLCPSALRSST